jgi:nucleoside-diphosphate-sugar epimerase
MSVYYAFEQPVVIARPFNTYGPQQSARAVIPTIISQIASGNGKIRIGDLSTTRDFTYVEDTCRGFIAIAEMEGGVGEVFHNGSNTEIAVGDLMQLVADVMGHQVLPVVESQRLRPKDSEVMRLVCDNTKLREATGFTPRVSLREGIARTAHWFKDRRNLSKCKEHAYNV